jgi:hypothetical protein
VYQGSKGLTSPVRGRVKQPCLASQLAHCFALLSSNGSFVPAKRKYKTPHVSALCRRWADDA